MRVLVIGSGDVGAAVASVAARPSSFEHMTFAEPPISRPALELPADYGEPHAVEERVAARAA